MRQASKFSSSIACLFAIVLVGVAGCDDGPDSSGAAEHRDAASIEDTDARDVSDISDDAADTRDVDDEYDEGCHYDCFTELSCSDGVVYFIEGGPIPCDVEDPDALCQPDEVGTCERGCSTAEDQEYWDFNPYGEDEDWWRVACEEGRPKEAGDPCESDEHCEPTPGEAVTEDGESTFRNTYLTCDEDAGECVEGEAPVVPDFRSWCGLEGLDVPDDGARTTTRSAPASGCELGWCIVVGLGDSEEVCQGCTSTCEVDSDCPQGARCTRLGHYDLGAPTPDGDLPKVCELVYTPAYEECRPI